jgi:hypothetical protein
VAGVKDDNRRCDEEEFFSFPIERREETISFRVLFFILIASYISTSIIISILKKKTSCLTAVNKEIKHNFAVVDKDRLVYVYADRLYILTVCHSNEFVIGNICVLYSSIEYVYKE